MKADGTYSYRSALKGGWISLCALTADEGCTSVRPATGVVGNSME
jgi:hypothetical protein